MFSIITILFYYFAICNCQNIQSIINNAIYSGLNEVILPSGTFIINEPINIYAANNLKIIGTDTKLIFATTRTSPNRYFDITVVKSNYVTIQDIEIDMDPLPFTQGRVTKVDFKFFDVEIDDGYPTDNSFFGKDSYVHLHDPLSRRFKQEGDISYVEKTEAISGGLRVFINGNTVYSNIKVGDLVSIGRPGFMCTFSLYDTQNTILQNIVIKAAQGCGVLENDGSGTIIDGIIIKRGEKPNGAIEERLLSINRDGFHLNGPKGGTIIKNCFIEFSGDDAINVRSSFGRITSVIGNIINFEPSFVRFSPGTDLYVYDQDTLTLKDTVYVKNHQIERGNAEVASTLNMKNGNLIVSPQHTQNFRIINNKFVDIDARGIVATGGNIHIEKNTIERTTMGGIWVGSEMGYYLEGGFADNVYIKENIITDSSYTLRGRRQSTQLLGAISIVNEFKDGQQQQLKYKFTRPNKNIIIAENSVTRASMASIFINAAVNVSVCKNNLFFDNQLNNNQAGHEFSINPRYSVTIHDVSGVKLHQNWIQTGPNTIDMKWVSDSDNVIDLANNPCI